MSMHLPRFGIDASMVDTTDLDAVRAAIRPETRLVFVETPGNPLVTISDIAAIAAIAHDSGAYLAVDSTWSGLVAQSPMQLGADFVIHSATKYLNGHGDALAGAIMGPRQLLADIREYGIVHLGACISPFNAWLIMRGLVTLPLRMKQHALNAHKVTQFLASQTGVFRVHYPGHPDHPQYEVAQKQMSDFSGMLNFSLNLELLQNFDFIKSLRLIRHAVSLGHDQSLILFIPTVFFFEDMVQFDAHQKEKYAHIMGEGIYRFSVGLESPEVIIEDLSQALEIVGLGN